MGECHYQSGNYEAMIIAETCRQVLKDAGVNPDRI
ncbi:MAG: hydrogenase iron-sulfur subunit, partial [Deltaproteobacteria bacterium]